MMVRTLLFLALLAPPVFATAAGPLRYNRDIRPILSDNCFACHGPDKNHREADLRLDVREAAIEMKAITPGKPEKSSLMDRILTHDEDDLMPPPESKKTLTAEQKEILAEWIRQGAPYEPHWAYTPLVKPTLPAGTSDKPAIDAFIQAALSAKGIAPSPQADAHTLIRRLSLDLVGLPPSPAEVSAFEQDFTRDPQKAVETWTTRLMESPHFGERWAAWWLDVARFSDTVGFHGDQNQRVFPYRDYVIAAFNTNKRFDQFTLEQLAGDLLPNPTTEQLIATGFNRLNMMTREGGAQPKEYLAKYQADRVRTIGGTWLGATLGCAECHDHKFDPFTAHDFYAMSAYFADVKQFGVYSSYGYTPVEELKGWSNEHPFPPELQVDSPYLQKRLAHLKTQMDQIALKALQAAPKTEVQQWRRDTLARLKTHPEGWFSPTFEAQTTLAPPSKKGAPPKPKPTDAKSVDDSRITAASQNRLLIQAKAAQNTTLTYKASQPTRIAAVRLELLPDAAHQGSIELNGATNGLALTPSFSVRHSGAAKDTPVSPFHADADLKEPRYSSTAEVPGIVSGWKTSIRQTHAPHTGIYLLDQPVDLQPDETFSMRLSNHSAGCLRLAFASVSPPSPLAKNWITPLQASLEKEDLTSPLYAQAWLLQSGQKSEALTTWKSLHAQVLECNDGRAWTQVTVAVQEPLTIRRLPRGNWMDETGEICPPAPPAFIAGALPANSPRQSRLDLARWLTSPQNPLTARTFVNRLWKQFFGNGLSQAVDDLGAQGETPSHPELLDWLAAEFRDSGWDIQHVMRLMVTSATYQQDSRTRPELSDIDPGNRLLAYQNPRRLDAEFVRDNALFITGLINLDIGGPSVKPYQPGGYYENLQFPSRDYIASTDDRQWRRGVYMHWQRTFLHPMLANFDAPARDECTASRNVSNTPQQALTLLNDPTFVEAARTFAENLPAGSDQDRINTIYQRTLARAPKPNEQQSLLAFLKIQRETYQAAPADAQKLISTGLRPAPQGNLPELAAWTSVCRVVLNLHETITRY
ncbi:Planctomycete cytochrome C [Prosthecobacter debontii]|uniref:Planctomycete cytochrome C n=1 Tax=Prosthecobacter debontii TaxID=48467 RepID=A0A1T4YLE3_9BACT|nr:PSD1 and planctomycete cytochrome C domain-containing protein [Prosthecobacter debontii]SKB02378.1 Planctomycete cytochrome C [Prosthecobacter debontii]